eukprot:gene3706-4226_t
MENSNGDISSPISLTIYYASQTGQAEAIAKEIYDACADQNILAHLYCLSLTEKKFCITNEKLAVFVVSTTGDGEYPDTARKFMRRLNKKTLSQDYLKDLWFGFLALGDSNYTNFCNAGKKIEKRLLKLGARSFYPAGYADDAVGLELVVEPWIEGLWPALRKHANSTMKVNRKELKDQAPKERDKEDEPEKDQTSCKFSELQARVENGLSNLILDDIAVDNTVKEVDNQTCKTSKEIVVDVSSDISKSSSETKDNEPATISNGWTIPYQNISDKTLKLPKCNLSNSFKMEFNSEMKLNHTVNDTLKQTFPSAASEVKMATIVTAKKLTAKDSVKTALELELNISDFDYEYQPGDTFSIVCPNDDQTVEFLLQRLGLTASADFVFTVKSSENGGAKSQSTSWPDYIPQESTLRHVLKTSIDIRAVPKKALLRWISEYTDNADEKRRLQELCSIQGAKEYTKWIREPQTDMIDILKAFPSCRPPIDRLLASLPRLQPRPYSVASSPLHDQGRVKFVFNIAVVKGLDGVTRPKIGLCTGWLDRITAWKEPDEQQKRMACPSNVQIPVFWRNRTAFQLPADQSLPLIMIGPGTGVAPFIGFLQHRELQKKANSSAEWGSMFLFFGCRHKESDFLYRKELEEFVNNNILTQLFVSFSRDENQDEFAPKYVQDNMKQNQELLMSLIVEKGAVVYICGDAANMARNVRQAMLKMFQETQNISEELAIAQLKNLCEKKRYLEDVWT